MQRDFKGIWIPREVWLDANVTKMEAVLWAEINSLYDKEKDGCFASNEYFSKILALSDRRLREMIASLKSKNLIEVISFNGRERVLKALDPCRSDRKFSAGLHLSFSEGKQRPYPYKEHYR